MVGGSGSRRPVPRLRPRLLPRRAGRALASLAIVLLALAGPARVAAHAELVAATPGPGDVVAASPSEIRLVFSEPLEGTFTSLEVLGADGHPAVSVAGAIDPADRRALVAPIPRLPAGSYTVVWRTVSSADGHAEQGAYVFTVGTGGVGASATPAPTGAPGPSGAAGGGPAGSGPGGGSVNRGGAQVEATFLLDAGLLLAFGLVVLAWSIFERIPRGVPPRLSAAVGIALVVGGAGALLMIVASSASIGADPIEYATRSRPGLLLLARGAIGVAGGLGALALVRGRRLEAASDLGMFAAVAALALTSIAGHAAAFDSPAPIVADAVHLGAAGTWLAGLVVLAAYATFGRGDGDLLRAIVPRFSALALVSIALVALTGVYSAWLETGDFTAFGDPYVRILSVKVAVALAAFVLGAANFLLRDPVGGRLGGFGRRVGVEAGLAIVVVVVTAALTNSAPAASGRPILLAEAPSGAAGRPATLAIAPGRPGPNRVVARLDGDPLPAGSSVSVALDRLDASAPELVADLRPAPEDPRTSAPTPGVYAAEAGALPATSRWDAVLVVRARDGTEVARHRFTFAFDATQLSEGRSTPPLDPAIAAALALLAFGLLGAVFAAAGGSPPRVEPRTGRLALGIGGTIAAVLGALLLLIGPAV